MCDSEPEEKPAKVITTWQKDTHEEFLVPPQMLVHQGKQYTENDIAKYWKKDCRTWLWKNKKKGAQQKPPEKKDEAQPAPAENKD